MKNKFYSLVMAIFILSITFMFTACGTTGIYNVQKTFTKENSSNNVEKQIIKAGEILGWKMKKTSSSTILASLFIRNHTAEINITFNNSQYKIDYVKSTNLNYSKETNTIHSNYNGWISNLENSINNFLDELVYNKELIEEEQISKNDKLIHENNNLRKTKNTILDLNVIMKNKSINEIEEAILKAGDNLGWKIQKQNDGFILARLVLRTHLVIVRIDYSKEAYTITYIKSKNLDYNYKGEYTIHSNYNGWIQNLNNSINFYL